MGCSAVNERHREAIDSVRLNGRVERLDKARPRLKGVGGSAGSQEPQSLFHFFQQIGWHRAVAKQESSV